MGIPTRETRTKIVIVSCFLVTLVAGCWFVMASEAMKQAEERFRAEAVEQCKNAAAAFLRTDGRITLPNDAWGRAYRAEYADDQYQEVATVVSAGADGEFLTDDDIVKEKRDIKKSRLVGEWAGSKTKPLVKGFVKGLLTRED